MTVLPYSPDEVMKRQRRVPEFVISAVNELLLERLENGECAISESDVFDRVKEHAPDKETVLQGSCDDIAALYRAAGWDVEYVHAQDADAARFLFKKML